MVPAEIWMLVEAFVLNVPATETEPPVIVTAPKLVKFPVKLTDPPLTLNVVPAAFMS